MKANAITMFNQLGILEKVTIGLAGLILIASILVFGLRSDPSLSTTTPNPYANLGGDFTLDSVNGPVSLEDYRGSVVLMMFGFTNCPDVCPTELANVAAALSFLNEQQREKTQPIFISLDPDRDSLKHLDQYTRYFNPKTLGITGDKTKLDQIVKNYGSFYQFVPLPDSELKYSVDHAARIYVIDKQGKLNQALSHNIPPQQLAEAVQALL